MAERPPALHPRRDARRAEALLRHPREPEFRQCRPAPCRGGGCCRPGRMAGAGTRAPSARRGRRTLLVHQVARLFGRDPLHGHGHLGQEPIRGRPRAAPAPIADCLTRSTIFATPARTRRREEAQDEIGLASGNRRSTRDGRARRPARRGRSPTRSLRVAGDVQDGRPPAFHVEHGGGGAAAAARTHERRWPMRGRGSAPAAPRRGPGGPEPHAAGWTRTGRCRPRPSGARALPRGGRGAGDRHPGQLDLRQPARFRDRRGTGSGRARPRTACARRDRRAGEVGEDLVGEDRGIVARGQRPQRLRFRDLDEHPVGLFGETATIARVRAVKAPARSADRCARSRRSAGRRTRRAPTPVRRGTRTGIAGTWRGSCPGSHRSLNATRRPRSCGR